MNSTGYTYSGHLIQYRGYGLATGNCNGQKIKATKGDYFMRDHLYTGSFSKWIKSKKIEARKKKSEHFYAKLTTTAPSQTDQN